VNTLKLFRKGVIVVAVGRYYVRLPHTSLVREMCIEISRTISIVNIAYQKWTNVKSGVYLLMHNVFRK
jgi:hypothetical protein